MTSREPRTPRAEAAVPPWGALALAKHPVARSPLTAERIADAALAIIDAEGTEAVSMRRVAGDLSVVASSLYVHVRNREELLRLVADRVEAEVSVPPRSGDWRVDLRAYAVRRHRVLESHSDIAVLNFGAIPATPRAIDNLEAMLSMLLDAGMSPQVATWGLERLELYVTADALEGWHFARRYAGGPQEFMGPVEEYFAALSPDDFPALTRHHRVLVEGDGQQRFEMGLDLLIAGMEQLGMASGTA